MPDNRGFDGFFNEKVIKTYKCNRLLDLQGKLPIDKNLLPAPAPENFPGAGDGECSLYSPPESCRFQSE
jgi:hypothetical protein